jgi:hypothetical protein
LLLAFFWCTGFVKREKSDGNEGDGTGESFSVELPPVERLFDQRGRPFRPAVERQIAEDGELDAASEEAGHAIDSINVILEPGLAHDQVFASDNLEEDERSTVATHVRDGLWSLTDTKDQLKGRLERHREASKPSNRASSANPEKLDGGLPDPAPPAPPPPRSEGAKPDTAEIPDGFEPCDHFRTTIDELKQSEKIRSETQASVDPEATQAERILKGQTEIFQAIIAVARALNELQPSGHGFTVQPQTADGLHSINSFREEEPSHDSIVLQPFEFQGNNLLLVFQLEQREADEHTTVYVVDSAPWVLTAGERAELYQIVKNMDLMFETTMPASLTWIFGAEQGKQWQANYFTVLNAWSILFGLPLNTKSFTPKESFLQDTDDLVRAVWGGLADWKLVWSFLRCAGYIAGEEQPVFGRRFTQTVSPAQLKEHKLKMNNRGSTSPDRSSHKPFYRHFREDLGRPHNVNFLWDDFELEDRQMRIPAL